MLKKLAILFFLDGIVLAILGLSGLRGFHLTTPGDLLLVTLVGSPLVPAAAAGVGLLRPQLLGKALWLNVVWWFVMAGGEMMEPYPWAPNSFLVVMTVGLGIFALVALVVLRRKG